MNNHITENEEIAAYSRELKLPTFKEGLDDVIAEATEQGWSYRKFLSTLLYRELEQRGENRKYLRIRKACFPQLKYLQELVREDLPPEGHCTWTWTRHYDISFQLDGSGYTVVSKINGNSIYLPLAGFYDHDRNAMTIWVGEYLSSTLSDHTEYVSALGLGSDRTIISNMQRFDGVSVRPVIKP